MIRTANPIPATVIRISDRLLGNAGSILVTRPSAALAEPAAATTTEVSGSRAIDVSQPSAVARLITQAAQSLVQTPEIVG